MIPAICFGKSLLQQFLSDFFEVSSFLARHLISSSQFFSNQKPRQVKLLIFYIGQAAKWFVLPSNSRCSGLFFKKSHAFAPLYLLLTSRVFFLPKVKLSLCMGCLWVCVCPTCYFQTVQKSFFSFLLLLYSFSPTSDIEVKWETSTTSGGKKDGKTKINGQTFHTRTQKDQKQKRKVETKEPICFWTYMLLSSWLSPKTRSLCLHFSLLSLYILYSTLRPLGAAERQTVTKS